ncbi:MAG: hypothetical protein R2940_05345 [Syntrophotaleaceae bacterium]
MTVFRFIAVSALCSLMVVVSPVLLGISAVSAEEKSHEEFNIKGGGGAQKENLFNLFFGHIPMMPTQRGTVIIEAYHDVNGNQRRDEGEEKLEKVISAIVDEVEYDLPAFIPGLDNGKNYTILFEGSRYQPVESKKEVFIKKRGQIIRIDLPCREGNPNTSLAAKEEREERLSGASGIGLR